MPHSHMVGGFRMHMTPASNTPAMTKPRPIGGKIGNGRHPLLLVILRIGNYTGHGSHEYANLPDSMHHDQEAMH